MSTAAIGADLANVTIDRSGGQGDHYARVWSRVLSAKCNVASELLHALGDVDLVTSSAALKDKKLSPLMPICLIGRPVGAGEVQGVDSLAGSLAYPKNHCPLLKSKLQLRVETAWIITCHHEKLKIHAKTTNRREQCCITTPRSHIVRKIGQNFQRRTVPANASPASLIQAMLTLKTPRKKQHERPCRVTRVDANLSRLTCDVGGPPPCRAFGKRGFSSASSSCVNKNPDSSPFCIVGHLIDILPVTAPCH